MHSYSGHRHVDLRRRGVTLIELLAIVAIVGVLLAVVWVAVAGKVKSSAKQTVLKSDMRQVILGVNLYRSDNDQGLPSDWKDFGYYGINRKGYRGGNYFPWDAVYSKPPSYDVSYHTPECAQPPRANMGFIMFRQMVSQFQSIPRANTLDVEHDQAAVFWPACLANSLVERYPRVLQAGVVKTPTQWGYRTMGMSLSGTLSYEYGPDWFHESAVGF